MQRPTSRGVRSVLLVIVLGLATALLLVTTALGALRDRGAVQEFAEVLASEPQVQQLVTASVADALIADVAARAPLVAPLLPVIRPALLAIASDVIASEAGTAALASAIADAFLQVSVSGPIVLDLRAALIDGAATAPEPIASLARAAALDGDVGLIVLRSDGRSAAEVLAGRAGSRIGAPAASSSDVAPRVLGARTGVVRMIAIALLLVASLALVAPTSPPSPAASASATASTSTPATGRAPRIAWAAAGVLIAAAPAAIALRLVPAALITRSTATESGPPPDATLEMLAPFLIEGVERMLSPTRMLAELLTLLATLVLCSALALVVHRAKRRLGPDVVGVAVSSTA